MGAPQTQGTHNIFCNCRESTIHDSKMAIGDSKMAIGAAKMAIHAAKIMRLLHRHDLSAYDIYAPLEQ